MLLVWVCSNGIVSVPRNTRCVDTFRLDMDMTRCTCNKLSDCPQGLGFPVELPHNGHMSTQHIHPTPSNWWPRNPWSATLTYQTKKVWHGKQMDGGQVIKGFRVIQGSRFTSWSSILNSRRLKVQAITTPTFRNYFGRIIYTSGNECPCISYQVYHTNATNEPVQDCIKIV